MLQLHLPLLLAEQTCFISTIKDKFRVPPEYSDRSEMQQESSAIFISKSRPTFSITTDNVFLFLSWPDGRQKLLNQCSYKNKAMLGYQRLV